MNTFVNAAVQVPDSVTENGAATFASSLNMNVDLFFKVGASRGKLDQLISLFKQALKEDSKLATRIALWARDARGGAGERDAFRAMLKEMSVATQLALIPKIVELGRWDDLAALIGPDSTLACANNDVDMCAAYFWKQAVLDGNGLAAKWAPRKGPLAVKLRTFWGMSPKQYRKTLVNATKVVETQMCAKDWDNINFNHVPSVAAARYNAAFMRNAAESYTAYKEALVSGEAKINASAIFPHDVVRGALVGAYVDTDVVDAQWKALPDYLNGDQSGILVMSDVSGSMNAPVSGSIRAIDISVALGLYISERQTGPFKDLVLTFSETPTFHKVVGTGIVNRIKNLSRSAWGMSTDLAAAFKLILDTAVANQVPAEDMPHTLLILSDMEFDYCGRITNFQYMEALYEKAGYVVPKIVFWNLNSRSRNVPVRAGEHGVALVSGFSPSLMKSILLGENMTPESVMLSTVSNPRYDVDGVTV